MNAVKKFLGVVWLALGAFAGYDRVMDSMKKISSAKLDDNIFGYVILFVLTPMIVGSLVLFGVYCLRGEYDVLPDGHIKDSGD